MMSAKGTSLILALLLALLVVAGALAAAQANEFRIERWTLDNGGGVSAADPYRIAGTIGQPDASGVMSGEGYSLTGGYWGLAPARVIYLPLILRSSGAGKS